MIVIKLLLSLSILVILHEFGHFITARWFGCRVERFFLFFDPYFALFKKKIGDTVYGIGWLPLGGYVKIAGMVDESMDKEQLALPPQPDEFRSKPGWQRLIIMLGGIIMNLIVAFVIYAVYLMVKGETKIPNETLKYGIQITDSIVQKSGFKNGDKILAADGEKVEYFENVPRAIIMSRKITIEREGKTMDIEMPIDFIGQLVEKVKGKAELIEVRKPVFVDSVDPVSPAGKAGFKKGDQLIGMDSSRFFFFDEFKAAAASRKNQDADFYVLRNNDTVQLHGHISSEGTLGFFAVGDEQALDSMGIIKLQKKTYGFFAAIPGGIRLAGQQLSGYVSQFKLIFNPKTGAYKGLGGFKGIAKQYDANSWNWTQFWLFTAFLSIALAFMNLLPIPALDGGHVLFTLIEMVSGRKPNQKFLEYAQIVGIVIVLALMLYVNFNDWFGYGRGK